MIFQNLFTSFFSNFKIPAQLLSVDERKELWLETRTGNQALIGIAQLDPGEGRTYFYNPTSFRCSFERPPASRAVVVPQAQLQKLLDAVG